MRISSREKKTRQQPRQRRRAAFLHHRRLTKSEVNYTPQANLSALGPRLRHRLPFSAAACLRVAQGQLPRRCQHTSPTARARANKHNTMTSQRSTTLAVLGLLAGFVDVDAFRLIPASTGVVSSSLARAQQQRSAVSSRGASTGRTWSSPRSGLTMSSPAVGSDLRATEELEDKPSRASVMDELDAILGDVKMVSRGRS